MADAQVQCLHQKLVKVPGSSDMGFARYRCATCEYWTAARDHDEENVETLIAVATLQNAVRDRDRDLAIAQAQLAVVRAAIVENSRKEWPIGSNDWSRLLAAMDEAAELAKEGK